MADTPLINVRLDAETLSALDRLREHFAAQDSLGRAVTRADVLRTAIRVLAAQTLPAEKKQKKSSPST